MDRRRFMQTTACTSLALAGAGATTTAAADAAGYLERVTGLIGDWRRKDIEGVLARVSDDIVWHSHVGSPPVLGKAAMGEVLVAFSSQMSEVRWRIFDFAQNENRVFLEGVDDFISSDGRRIVVPYAGVLAFRGPLISEWRDYFDRGLFNKLKAGEPMPDYVDVLTTRKPLF